MIKQCKCDHKGQDQLHGKHMRVHNPTKQTKGTEPVIRCTVCKDEKTVREVK